MASVVRGYFSSREQWSASTVLGLMSVGLKVVSFGFAAVGVGSQGIDALQEQAVIFAVGFLLLSLHLDVLKRLDEIRQQTGNAWAGVRYQTREVLKVFADDLQDRAEHAAELLGRDADIDKEFWNLFRSRFIGSAAHPEAKGYLFWIVMRAVRDGGTRIRIPSNLQYEFMCELLNQVVKSGSDEYLATMVLRELDNRDAADFLLPSRMPRTKRIILADRGEIEQLQSVGPLLKQMRKGVELYCLPIGGRSGARRREEYESFGVYGELGVGEMYKGWNSFAFDRESINRRREEWLRLRRTANRIGEEDGRLIFQSSFAS